MNTIFQNDVIKCLELDSGKTLERLPSHRLTAALTSLPVPRGLLIFRLSSSSAE